jgi:hypothetical protein
MRMKGTRASTLGSMLASYAMFPTGLDEVGLPEEGVSAPTWR